jgi:hypothetical protein
MRKLYLHTEMKWKIGLKGRETGVHKLSKNVGFFSKFQALDLPRETNYTPRTQKSRVTYELHRYLALSSRCASTVTYFWYKENKYALTLILLTWRIWRAPNNASKWQMGFNSAFKGLIVLKMWHYLSKFCRLSDQAHGVRATLYISVGRCQLNSCGVDSASSG